MPPSVDTDTVAAFTRDGAVCLRGVFTEWIETLAEGVAHNETDPGPYFAENVVAGERGRFWDDYCNWTRIRAFERFAFESAAAELAAELMETDVVQLFHDHVLVKEPDTPTPTPWHSDRPYYFVEGSQTLSFWIPLDPVSTGTTLRVIAGSHRWERDVVPVRWLAGDDFYAHADDYLPVPDPDAEPNRYDVLDRALTRPGRFDRVIHVKLPGARARERILRLHCAKITAIVDANLTAIANKTRGMSGAQLSALVNEAAIRAYRRGSSEQISEEDFAAALHTVQRHAEAYDDW